VDESEEDGREKGGNDARHRLSVIQMKMQSTAELSLRSFCFRTRSTSDCLTNPKLNRASFASSELLKVFLRPL
jgi:hypothetical protein